MINCDCERKWIFQVEIIRIQYEYVIAGNESISSDLS